MSATNDRTNEYRTTDLNVAAFLVARGYTMTGIERLTDGRRGVFLFGPGARADVDQYFLNAPVGARDFAAALKNLKAALHAS
jgi:hypothetical protein